MNETDRYDLQLQRMVNSNAAACAERRRWQKAASAVLKIIILALYAAAGLILGRMVRIVSTAVLLPVAARVILQALCWLAVIGCIVKTAQTSFTNSERR